MQRPMSKSHDGVNEDLYSPDDVTQMFKADLNAAGPSIIDESEDVEMRDEVEKLLLGCNAHDGIDILDAFLSLPGRPIGPGLIFEWLCCRAKFLLERNWKNDAHMAIRDCDRARKLKQGDYRPFYYLSTALLQDFKAIDMKQRFIGHRNLSGNRCDAHFLGPTGDYIVSASDDNRLYIWEKRSGRLVRTLKNEKPAETLLRCHPFDFAVATAGLGGVEIWASGAMGVETDADDDLTAMDLNQAILS